MKRKLKPAKYVRGSKDPEKIKAEIKRTRRLYRMGMLTPAYSKQASRKS